MVDSKKDELVRFLEKRAFKPVLNAKPKGRSKAEQKKLEHVQKVTRAEIERFHNYGSAQEVMTNSRRDLDSEPAKRVHAELRSLDLPTLNEVHDEVERRAEELSVTGRLSSRMPIHSAHKLAILAQPWGVDGQHRFF